MAPRPASRLIAGLRAIGDGWTGVLRPLLDPDGVPAKARYVLLAMIVIGCAGVRVWTMGSPALDRTLWKEIDYLSISTNYAENGFALLRPEVWWPAEGPRATAMELPLVPFATALGYPMFGINAYSVRWLTALSFLVVILYTYRLARRELGAFVALAAALAAAVMPLYHTFGRVLFSEPPVIACSLVAVYHFAEWVETGQWKDWILALAGFTLAVSLKLTPLYLLLPLAWIAVRTFRNRLPPYRSAALLVAVSLIVPAAWFAYAYHLKTTSLDVFGVFGGHDKMQTFRMLSSYSWYYTMYERLTWGILGGKIGTVLAVAGMGSALLARRGGVFLAYLTAIGVFFVVVAEGQIDAPYRQLTSVPPLAGFVGLGAVSAVAAVRAAIKGVTRATPRSTAAGLRSMVAALGLTSLLGATRLSDILDRDTTQPASMDRWLLAQELRGLAPRSGKIVAAGEYTIHQGGNDLSPVLYHYAQRQGWTLQRGDWRVGVVDSLIRRGASHFVAIKMEREPDAAGFLEEMRDTFPTVYEHEERRLLILALTPRADRRPRSSPPR